MVKNHLKRIAVPKSWPVKRKEEVFVIRPNPGLHSINTSVPLKVFLTHMIKIAKITKECKYIVNNKEVFVDGKRRKSIAFPVGIFDVITLKDINKSYRVLMDNKGVLVANEINGEESKIKPKKVVGKVKCKNKLQINFNDGTNMFLEDNDIKVGDTIIMDLTTNQLKQKIKLEKGNTIILLDGKNKGAVGKVEAVAGNKIIYKIKTNEVYETLKKYAFVIGEDKPIIILVK